MVEKEQHQFSYQFFFPSLHRRALWCGYLERDKRRLPTVQRFHWRQQQQLHLFEQEEPSFFLTRARGTHHHHQWSSASSDTTVVVSWCSLWWWWYRQQWPSQEGGQRGRGGEEDEGGLLGTWWWRWQGECWWWGYCRWWASSPHANRWGSLVKGQCSTLYTEWFIAHNNNTRCRMRWLLSCLVCV